MAITYYKNDDDFIQDGVSTGMPKVLIDTLEVFNLTFYVIFLVEMIVKLLGLGPRTYVKDVWNIFDGFIVIICII